MPKNYLAILIILCSLVACSGKGTKTVGHNTSTTQEDLIAANRVLIKKDRQHIQGVVKRNAWEMTETETGLWVEIMDPGTGDSVKEGLVVTLKYTLSLLDGTICYSSDDSGLKVFEVGRGGVESGLEQGVLFCREGTRARFILPPFLAYGLPGDGDRIPARSILIYEIEVLNISNKE